MHEGHVKIPESMRLDHAEIHGDLVQATKLQGRIGDAARELARILHPHFVREEEIALPPLGLLEPLSKAPPTAAMREVLRMTDALRAELPKMLEEHKAIGVAARRLETVAREERDADGSSFTRGARKSSSIPRRSWSATSSGIAPVEGLDFDFTHDSRVLQVSGWRGGRRSACCPRSDLAEG